MKKKVKILIALLIAFIIFISTILEINFYVKASVKDKIVTIKEAKKIKNVDAIIVLGAGAWGDEPSPLLRDRLITGTEAYKNGISNKIIMSGDHGRKNYDEVNIMKKYVINENVPSEDIFMDHAGFSTYDSIYRAKHIFKAKKIIIVTQEYHLYRALYIAKKLGIDAYGIKAVPKRYAGDNKRKLREILARDKDFFKCIFKPKSTYLGEEIPLSENGNLTNDN